MAEKKAAKKTVKQTAAVTKKTSPKKAAVKSPDKNKAEAATEVKSPVKKKEVVKPEAVAQFSKVVEQIPIEKPIEDEAKTAIPTTVKVDYSVDLREMLEAGCHFGHQARRWNPKMAEYVYAERDNVHIFDLAKSAQLIVEAMVWVRDWVASGREIVFVGSKRQASAIVKEEALKAGAPFVVVRWMGGLLTNWDEMQKRIKRLNTLKEQRESGELAKKYTKKERVLIDREIAKLERFFGGLASLKEKPQALFVVDTHREITAVKEARATKVPVVGMVDTNADPDYAEKVIPVNDDAVRSIKLVVAKIAEAYADGKSRRGRTSPEATSDDKADGGMVSAFSKATKS